MQLLNNIPEIEELALPLCTAVNIVELLVEPFGTLDKARQFWQDYPCTLVCITKHDTPSTALSSLSDELLHAIEIAENEPEFVEFLSTGYQLSLTITNDVGNGLYLVKPTQLGAINDNTSTN